MKIQETYMTPGPQVAQDQELYRLGKRLDALDAEAKKYNRLSQERVAIEDERQKVWIQFRSLFEKSKGIREDHGMGYSHNVSVPGDENTMNKPTIIKEYATPDQRDKAVSMFKDDDRGYALIFQWVKDEKIGFKEFKHLISVVTPAGY